MADINSLRELEYGKVLEKIKYYAVSDTGKKLVLDTLPCDNYKDAQIMLEETNQADKLLYSYVISTDFSVEDITEILKKADKQMILSMQEILMVARNLRLSRVNKELITNINSSDIELMKDYAAELFADQNLENEINKAIISETEMSDNASYELKQIRMAILKCNDMIKQKLNHYVTSASYSKYLQDNIVTIRNNRYCLPVKSESRSQIQGLIHDQSASMATVFIEPFAIVEMNNELANLKISEQNEIERILKLFTIRISGSVKELQVNNTILSKLDCIFAKAQYSHKTRSVMPRLTTEDTLIIKRGRHPLIDKDKVVPINIRMDGNSKILIISGSNTGGKTVTMKLVGLSTLMAMSGIFPLCEEGSVIKYFDNIFCDIGDHQSIEMNLSTFSSHISNLVYITNNMTTNNLIMLDELGAGTDPIEGAGLAVAVTKAIIESQSFALITTHFTQMKELSNQYECVSCASMDFDPITYAPTYRLIMGSVGASNALKIAQRLGLREDILEKATSELPQDKVMYDLLMEKAERANRLAEDYKDDIHRMKNEINTNLIDSRKERELLTIEREKLNEKLKRDANIAIREYLEEADDLIEEIKECVNRGTEDDLFKARTLKSQLSKIEYDDEKKIKKFLNTPIVVGDSVFIESLNADGEILNIDERKKEYLVKTGRVQSKVKFGLVKKIEPLIVKEHKAPTVNLAKKEFSNVALPLELNIIGKNTEEGVELLEHYLENAIVAGYSEVRIVHGKGTGVLRKAVQESLKFNRTIKSYRLGNWGEGDTGVTMVTLK